MRWYCVMFRSFGLEELDTLLAQGQGYFHAFFTKYQFSRRREEVGNHLSLAKGFIGVYLIFALIDRLSFAPITGADDSNNRSTVSEPHCEHTTINFAKAIEPLFGLAVLSRPWQSRAAGPQSRIGRRKKK